MHEIDPAYGGIVVDAGQARDVARWRKAERDRLITTRMALTVEERSANAAAIAGQLDTLVTELAGDEPSGIVSFAWPFRAEPDLRPWAAALHQRGTTVALPVVVAKGQPLRFRAWTPSARMERGVWNIPFPADGPEVTPAIVIAPLVGFDPGCFRLGYGGGFFDRTLAMLAPTPVAIGVGHPSCAIATIYPQPHDIAMDWIVTGASPPMRRLPLSAPPQPG
jgi:5,10-methenyltetrahydrofolate synthetase